jgi:RNA polymerase sigma-70 factor (ECF subfamily)
MMTQPNPPTEDLEQLMRAAQQGDSAAYLKLLRQITPRIRHIMMRQRGFAGIAETEDLVQDVLLSLHAVRATYDPSRPFVPWLLAIVRNRLVDGARRYAKTSGREIRLGLAEIDVTFSDPATNTDSGEIVDAEVLRQAVRELPEGQRQAIELLKLEELSLKEAAAISGSSVGALKVATHRAMATLRRTLGVKGK